MTAVKILDAGGNILLSGVQAADVEAALRKYVARGASVVSEPSKLGSSWVAACTVPPKVPGADETTTLRLTDLAAAIQRKEAAAAGGAAKYVETGHTILISGPSRESVFATLSAFVSQGARITSEVTQIGYTWVASCERAEQSCEVQEMGLKRIVTGPTRESVDAKCAELVAQGATLVGEIEEMDGVWSAVCDTGGREAA